MMHGHLVTPERVVCKKEISIVNRRNLHAVLVRPYVRFPRETPRLRSPATFGRPGEHAHALGRCCTASGARRSGCAAVDDEDDRLGAGS